MRIHSLRLKNVNSLVGEWEIDFLDPAFADSGFFAITGPTGAGKSTVLDAVCLALYGRTPRLGKISNTANDIMSTNTAECSAEVVFGTKHGLFRSSWYQKRAHKKPGGALQQPERRLSDETTGVVIETKVRDIETLVEEYTGMDFERFTRTMFLAQGGFAAFLEAPDTERSGILEEITGTQVYSELSRMVFVRCREEESRYRELQREHDDLRLLTPEEEESMQERLFEAVKQAETLGEEVHALEDRVRWLDTLDRLTGEQTALLEGLGEAEQAVAGFSKDGERLELAKQARGAEAAYLDVRRRREEREQRIAQWEEEKGHLPLLEQNAADIRTKEESARKALGMAEKDRDADTGPAREARDLDTLIATKDKEHSGYTHDLTAREAEIATLLGTIGDLDSKRRDVLGQASGAERYLSENSRDSLLSEDLSGIENRCREYVEEAAGLSQAVEEHAAAEQSVAGQREVLERLEKETCQKEREREVIAGRLAGLEQALETLLGGREAREVRETHAALAVREQALSTLVKDARAIAEKRKKLEKAAAGLDEKKKAALVAAKDLEAAAGRKAWLSAHLDRLEGAVREATAALSAADLRKGLRDGVPCPVCGSPDHPYAGGNVPEIEPVREETREVSRDLENVRDEVNRLTGLSEGLESDVRNLAGQVESYAEDLERGFSAWQEDAGEHGIDLSGTSPVPAATGALKVCRAEIKAAKSQKDHMEALLEEIGMAGGDLEKHGAECQECRDALKDARSGLALREQEEHHAESRLSGLRTGAAARLAAFMESVAAYGSFGDASPDGVVTALRARKDRYERCRATIEEARREAERLSLMMERENTKKCEKESSCTELREKARTAGQECSGLREKRVAVYGDRDPDREQERLAKAVEELGRRVSAARKEREDQERALNALKVRLDVYERNDREMAAKTGSACRELAAKLAETGFSSEEELAAALLPGEVLMDLEERRNRLSDQLAAAKAKTGEKEREIARHRETGEVHEPRDILVQRLGEEREHQKMAEREVYDLESGLKGNLDRREQARGLGERLRAQDETVQTWRKLDALIGSATGKTFRTFAQGLTLGILLNSANVHLRRLSDRYRLTRTKDQPLGILVIDTYRAGEVRPTKNLSGGETFIVSLALALGLSEMAGKNVRVDSLFLDEGFGTLDEEALDTALSALGVLRQEGKLIGVISHVQAVKDRVPVQIQVEKLPGGRSRLSGPGCRSRDQAIRHP